MYSLYYVFSQVVDSLEQHAVMMMMMMIIALLYFNNKNKQSFPVCFLHKWMWCTCVKTIEIMNVKSTIIIFFYHTHNAYHHAYHYHYHPLLFFFHGGITDKKSYAYFMYIHDIVLYFHFPL